MRIANATNGLAYPPYDGVSMFLSTHGHNCKMGYFRMDAMPYMAIIHLLKGGDIQFVDATPSNKELPDAVRFGLTTWCLVFNRAIRMPIEPSDWVTRAMVRNANSQVHKKHIQRIRRLMEVFGVTKPAIIGDNILLEIHRKVTFDDKPRELKLLLKED